MRGLLEISSRRKLNVCVLRTSVNDHLSENRHLNRLSTSPIPNAVSLWGVDIALVRSRFQVSHGFERLLMVSVLMPHASKHLRHHDKLSSPANSTEPPWSASISTPPGEVENHCPIEDFIGLPVAVYVTSTYYDLGSEQPFPWKQMIDPHESLSV